MTRLVWIGGEHQDKEGYYNSGSPLLLLCCHVKKMFGRYAASRLTRRSSAAATGSATDKLWNCFSHKNVNAQRVAVGCSDWLDRTELPLRIHLHNPGSDLIKIAGVNK